MLRRIAVVVAALLLASGALAAEDLPKPASLEPAVAFWTRVYTEVDTHSGLIHDSEFLSVVYETVRFPAGASYRAREQATERAKRNIRAILQSLAKGKRAGLSSSEARVLAQWPSDVTNATLRKAVDQVRFQLGQADKFRDGLVRAGAWRDHVGKTLAARGVPPALVALPHVESSYNPKAYSRIGAAGMWQFTRSTGRIFMRVDSVVDERLDPYLASDAAARLLAKNRQLTGTWPLAITAYNHGAGGMIRASRTLGTTDMGEIVWRYRSRTFGFASRNFYASFLAASEIDRDPQRHFGPIDAHSPTEYTEVKVPWFTPADSLATALGIDLGVLRDHNPALRPAVWTGSKRVPSNYLLRVPRGTLTQPVSTLLAALPGSARHEEQHRDRFHTVRRGETLSRIASRYGVREAELVAANNLRSRNRIHAGQVLVLPGGAGGEVEVARAPVPDDGIYRVRRGDTLSIIARRFATSERALAAENGLRNRHRIAVGQRLRIPGGAIVVASATPAAQESPPVLSEPSTLGEPSGRVELAAKPAAPEPKLAEAAALPVEPEAKPALAAAPKPKPGGPGRKPPLAESASAPDPETATPEPEPAQEPDSAIPQPALAPDSPVPDLEPEPQTDAVPPPAAPGDPSRPPDPADYRVHGDRVTVQAAETLGHFAEWLEIRASRLRELNRMRFKEPVVIGRRLKLDFTRVAPEEFEQRRLEHHQSLQNEFFDAFLVTGTERHVLERGESLWYLANRKYRVPVWLLRQYNPDLDFAALPTGSPLIVPVVEPRTG